MKILFQQFATTCLIYWLLFGNSIAQQVNQEDHMDIRFYGVQIKVADMAQALEFYSKKMGFEVLSQPQYPREVMIGTASFPFKLVLAKSVNMTDFGAQANAKIAFQANKLLPTIDLLREKGVEFEENRLSRNGIGIGIIFKDPFNNRHAMAEVQVYPVPPFTEPQIYNVGFTVGDIEAAEHFYGEVLGFQIYSRNYLPAALPLKHSDDSFAFMLHFKKGLIGANTNYPDESQTLLMFSTSNLDQTYQILLARKVEFLFEEPKRCMEGRFLAFRDPSGNISELIELNE